MHKAATVNVLHAPRQFRETRRTSGAIVSERYRSRIAHTHQRQFVSEYFTPAGMDAAQDPQPLPIHALCDCPLPLWETFTQGWGAPRRGSPLLWTREVRAQRRHRTGRLGHRPPPQVFEVGMPQ